MQAATATVYAVIDNPATLPFAAADWYDGRLVLAAEQCNVLRLPEVDAELDRAGFEPDPTDLALYRSRTVAEGKAVRAIRLPGPTEIMHPSGVRQRVVEGWIVQRVDTPADVFLVPAIEFGSHYVRRAA